MHGKLEVADENYLEYTIKLQSLKNYLLGSASALNFQDELPLFNDFSSFAKHFNLQTLCSFSTKQECFSCNLARH